MIGKAQGACSILKEWCGCYFNSPPKASSIKAKLTRLEGSCSKDLVTVEQWWMFPAKFLLVGLLIKTHEKHATFKLVFANSCIHLLVCCLVVSKYVSTPDQLLILILPITKGCSWIQLKKGRFGQPVFFPLAQCLTGMDIDRSTLSLLQSVEFSLTLRSATSLGQNCLLGLPWSPYLPYDGTCDTLIGTEFKGWYIMVSQYLSFWWVRAA